MSERPFVSAGQGSGASAGTSSAGDDDGRGPGVWTATDVAALSEREQQYRAIFEATSDGLFITDLDTGYVVEANPAACHMHGYESMAGLHPTAFIHPNSHHLFEDYVEAVRAGREFRCQAQDVRRDGSIFDVEVIGSSFIYQGRPAILGVVRDVTENARAYQLLEQRVDERTREIQRRRIVAEGLRDLLAAVNSLRTLDEILIYIVEQSRRLLRSDAAAICLPEDGPEELALTIRASSGLKAELARVRLPAGGSSTGLAFTRLRPVVVTDVRAAAPSPPGIHQELELEEQPDYIKVLRLPSRLDDPSVVGYSARPPALRSFAREFGALLAVPLAVKGEAYGTLALYYRAPREFDVDEVRLASAFADQTALALENARLREQAEQAAVLVERQRLARDLHDAVTQTLFSASLFADVIPQLWEVDQTEARSRLQQLRTLTRGALAEMRLLLVELRPGTLTELSLTDLLRQLGDATAGNSGAKVSVQIDGPSPVRLAPDVHVALYRIAQEALHNIVKHARASQVTVMLKYRLDGVTLEITDDGRGFDPSNTPAGHLGVSIMRERADAIGARYRLVSSPASGTCITVDWNNAERPEA